MCPSCGPGAGILSYDASRFGRAHGHTHTRVRINHVTALEATCTSATRVNVCACVGTVLVTFGESPPSRCIIAFLCCFYVSSRVTLLELLLVAVQKFADDVVNAILHEKKRRIKCEREKRCTRIRAFASLVGAFILNADTFSVSVFFPCRVACVPPRWLASCLERFLEARRVPAHLSLPLVTIGVSPLGTPVPILPPPVVDVTIAARHPRRRHLGRRQRREVPPPPPPPPLPPRQSA